MKTIATICAALLLALPAVAQTDSNDTAAGKGARTGPISTQQFVDAAASGDMFEIQSSELALERADGDIRAFAEQLVNDHSKTSEELKQMVEAGEIQAALPTQMTGAHADMLQQLQALEGEIFAQKYRDFQVAAHEQAVDLFARYAESGDDERLRQWAADTRPALQHHLEVARQLSP